MTLRTRLTRAAIEAMVGYWSSPRRRANLAPYLGRILRSYVEDPGYRRHFDLWQSLGVHVTRNHFYSPVPDTSAIGREVFARESELPGVDIDLEEQRSLMARLGGFAEELSRIPRRPTGVPHEFHLNNQLFDGSDALVYHAMIRAVRPRRIIEVGSGFSTYLAAAAAARNGNTELVSIDPFPNETVHAGFPGRGELVMRPVQEIEPEFFDRLGENDILFIDSSHCARCGSDVTWLFLEVLPRLQPGVLVHVHDIFLPGDYPERWVRERQIFWNEQYLLQAFLAFNRDFRVRLANQLFWRRYPEEMKAALPECEPFWGGGSFWMQRSAS